MIRVLAGHVGQAQTTLCLYEGDSHTRLRATARHRLENASFSGLVSLIADFLHGARVDAAALATPGHVDGGSCLDGPLPWPVREADLPPLLGTPRVRLLQEAQAALLGVPEVAPEQLVWLQRGAPDPSHASALVEVGPTYGRALGLSPERVFATLAGRTPFAPRNAIERRLLSYLADRRDDILVQDILSAPGLGMLYEFLLHEGFAAPTALAEVQRAEDPNAAIARLGRRDLDRGCAAAVAFFVDLLGAELGNVAQQNMPRAGLYVAGDLVRMLRSALEQGELLDAFANEEALGPVLSRIPLALVDEPALPLLGAKRAAHAASLAG